MKKAFFVILLFLGVAFLPNSENVFAQNQKTPTVKSQEVSEEDGIPVLIKHLPDWENVRNRAILTHNVEDLRTALGERPVFDLINFAGGTEAVTANYPQGKLLILEYSTPQFSVDMDAKTNQRLAELGETQKIFYRRIGNYNVFVFDSPDETSANSLLEQIKYEKTVQWLGEDPHLQHKAERAFVRTTSDIFLSTLFAILIGLGLAIVSGIIAGFVFFYTREQRRATMHAFSDAGGMIRLNLDELSAQTSAERFLKD
ncbi:MAG TPA: hypothetical protein PKY59_08505 [Pyrinomonadaceae bacterium]|nr:hypothetical protein [Pyrinomonadaceae bacterium]